MSYFHSTSRLLLLSILVIAILTGCSASQNLKAGDAAVSQGDYYRAAQSYLSVLKGSFKKTETLGKLSEVAEPAYQQQLKVAEDLDSQGRFEEAITEYKELERFMAALRVQNMLSFQTIDTNRAIADASHAAADVYYNDGQRYYDSQQFTRAISSYTKVITLIGPYKDTKHKIADSHYRIAVQDEKGGRFRNAINRYLEADKAEAGYQRARQRVGSLYYYLGDHFLEQGHCRQAYNEFNQARNYGASFSDLASKTEEAKECGTVKLAFVEFSNDTGQRIRGMDVGNFIFDSIQSKTLAQSSEFIRLMNRDQLGHILREQNISMGRISGSGSLPSTVEGVDYLIFGKINQLVITANGKNTVTRSTNYEVGVERSYKNEKGETKTETDWVEQPMTYQVISDAHDILMTGTIRAISAKTSETIIDYQINQQIGDNIEYAHSYKARHDLTAKNIKLDNTFTQYASARKELKSQNDLAQNIVDQISTEMANRILNDIDSAGHPPDPTVLPLDPPTLGEN